MASEPEIEFTGGLRPVGDETGDWVAEFTVNEKPFGVRVSPELMDPNAPGFNDRAEEAAEARLRAAFKAGTLGKETLRVTSADVE